MRIFHEGSWCVVGFQKQVVEKQRAGRSTGMVLVGPTTYEREPERHPELQINSQEPFNAEPAARALVESYLTPEHFYYKRNHGPIPVLEDPGSWKLQVGGMVEKEVQLSLQDLKAMPKHQVVATLQCAGNRRTEMSNVRKVKGVGWGLGALGNASWGGARLSDVLSMVGVRSGARHVEFISVDVCKEENGGPYKASVSLQQACSREAEIILAYEMNGKELSRDHGFPLRVIVPGVIGARSVKWLHSLLLTPEECQGFFMQRDYKMFPPWVDWDNVDWPSRRPLMDFPVQCAICTPANGASLERGSMVKISGYALSGGGRGIERVDVSLDGGKSWVEAKRWQGHASHAYNPDQGSDKWAWVLWELTVPVDAPVEIVAKAVDASANVQPDGVDNIWNLRGVLNNSWHRIQVSTFSRPSSSL